MFFLILRGGFKIPNKLFQTLSKNFQLSNLFAQFRLNSLISHPTDTRKYSTSSSRFASDIKLIPSISLFRKKLLSGACSFDGRALSYNLHLLQKMGAKWSDLFDLQNAILLSLSDLSVSLDAVQCAMCIYSLGKLGLEYNKCDDETQIAICDISKRILNSKISEQVGHSTVLPQHQSNIFIGLNLMGLKCNDVDITLIQAINHSLQFNLGGFGSPQQLPNTVHS